MKFLVWKWVFGMCRHFCCICKHKTICSAKEEIKLNCISSCSRCVSNNGYCVMFPKKVKKSLLFKIYIRTFKK